MRVARDGDASQRCVAHRLPATSRAEQRSLLIVIFHVVL